MAPPMNINDMKIVSTEKLREEIAIKLQVMHTYLENAVGFLSVGDDRGSEYSMKVAASHFKVAVDMGAEIKRRRIESDKEQAAYDHEHGRGRSIWDRKVRRAGTGAAKEGDEDRVG